MSVMSITKKCLCAVLVSVCLAGAAPIPSSWTSRGVGGGGSLFSPSINPADTNEFYVVCDMSELFHTNDFGQSYETVPFIKYRGPGARTPGVS